MKHAIWRWILRTRLDRRLDEEIQFPPRSRDPKGHGPRDAARRGPQGGAPMIRRRHAGARADTRRVPACAAVRFRAQSTECLPSAASHTDVHALRRHDAGFRDWQHGGGLLDRGRCSASGPPVPRCRQFVTRRAPRNENGPAGSRRFGSMSGTRARSPAPASPASTSGRCR